MTVPRHTAANRRMIREVGDELHEYWPGLLCDGLQYRVAADALAAAGHFREDEAEKLAELVAADIDAEARAAEAERDQALAEPAATKTTRAATVLSTDLDVVEARKLTPGNLEALWEWADSKPHCAAGGAADGLTVWTPKGRDWARFGDWVVRDADGKFWRVPAADHDSPPTP